VQNGIAILREQRTGTVSHDAAEVTDITIGILLPVEDVDPFELTAVILRVEVQFGVSSHRAGNHGTEHILMEDVAEFVVCGLVVGVHIILVALGRCRPGEGVHADELVLVIARGHVIDAEPRRIRINSMVETTVAAFDPEGSEQIVGFRPAEVLTDVSIQPDEVFAGFSTADQHEHRRTVFTAHGVTPSAVADEFHVEPLQDALSQRALRERGRGDRARGKSRGNAANNRVINRSQIAGSCRTRGGGNDRGRRGVDQVSFSRNLGGELIPIPFLPDEGGGVGQHVHDVGELFAPLDCKTQVFEGDVRAFDSGPLQAVLAELLTESNSVQEWGNNVPGRVSGITGRGARSRDSLRIRVEPGVGLVNRVRSQCTPVATGRTSDFTVGVTVGVSRPSCVKRGGGEVTLESNRANHITHLLGELFLLGQFEPGRSINRPAINLRSDTTSFFYKELLDVCVRRSHVSVCIPFSHPLARAKGW